MLEFTVILFALPDNRVVLQRRTLNVPYGPGKLGLFGGKIEEGETPLEGLLREIIEETSLKIGESDVELLTEIRMPPGQDFPQERRFYLYRAEIDDLSFEVYEGDGAEAFLLEEVVHRDDLVSSLEFILNQFPTRHPT